MFLLLVAGLVSLMVSGCKIEPYGCKGLGCNERTRTSTLDNQLAGASLLPRGLLAQYSGLNPNNYDATLSKFSIAGSSVPLSTNSGTATVTLYQNGAVIASNAFNWIRNGTEVIFSQPAVVNAWVRQYPSANDVEIEAVLPYTVTPGQTVTINRAVVHNGVTLARSSNTFVVRKPGGSLN